MKFNLMLFTFILSIQLLPSEEIALEINPQGQVSINLNGDSPTAGVDLQVRGRSRFENIVNLPPLSIPPTHPLEGDLYLDTNGQLLLFFNSGWNILAQPEPLNPFLDFSDYNLSYFDLSQNHSQETTQVQADQFTISIEGNAWRKIDFSQNITQDTVLEFEFYSSIQGEIHGIGFSKTDSINAQYTFSFYGTQNWGISTYRDYESYVGQWKSYSIPVGHYFQGQFNYLIFANDHDQSPKNGESVFRNIKLFTNP